MYVDPEIRKKRAEQLLASSRYSGDVNAIKDSLCELDRINEILDPYEEIVPAPRSITKPADRLTYINAFS